MPSLRRTVLHLRQLVRPRGDTPASDRQLLAAFAATRDESAFAELVRRHGPLVRGVCRRLLGADAAAEDAFQATFLLLARKAGSPGWRNSVGPWLYAAAWRIARKARVAAVRQQAREARAPAPPPPTDPVTAAAWRELCRVLDEELGRLPERLRAPLVLCYLEGRTRDEAARLLCLSLGTVKDRLERGRAILRARLIRRGVALTIAGLSAALAEAPVSAAEAGATARTAAAFVTGTAIAAPVAALLCGSRSLLGGAVLGGVGAVLLAGALAAGVAHYGLSGELPPPAAPPKASAPAAPVVRRDQFNDPLPPGAVARFGTVMLRHGDDIQGVQFTPDGQKIVSWAWDGVYVWNAGSGNQVRRFAERPHTTSWQMQAAGLSPDGRTMAVVYSNPRQEQLPH
jgi:RNA polymerase sigma factor (sigma-70 family)